MLTWTLEAQIRRQEGKKWLAKIVGADSANRSGFAFEFVEAVTSEWGKFGIRKAVFEIERPGYYYDSDGDYFQVYEQGGELEHRIVEKTEIKQALGLIGAPKD